MDDRLAAIERLFVQHGERFYDGKRAEPVSALAHALQCAQFAETAQADAALVTAALLHDVGHFLPGIEVDEGAGPDTDIGDDRHEQRGAGWLAAGFGPAVTEPIRLHVEAKRYLAAADPAYAATLTPASVHSLALQGGPMSIEERRRFAARPFAAEAVQLRRWDDLAKEPGRRTAPLAHFLAVVQRAAAHASRQAGAHAPTSALPAQSTRRPSR